MDWVSLVLWLSIPVAVGVIAWWSMPDRFLRPMFDDARVKYGMGREDPPREVS